MCGKHSEAYPDPGQYIVTVKPVLPIGGRSRASIQASAQLRNELAQLGYEVLEKPIPCSPFAKLRG